MIAPIHHSSSHPRGRRRPQGSGQNLKSQAMATVDMRLVQQFKAGDEAAFLQIMTRYRTRMYSLSLAKLGSHADAEEIVQDTFIRAHRALANFRGESSLATWLYRIALNLSHNRYWYHYRRRRHASLSFDVAFSESNQATLAELVASDTLDPVRSAEANEFSELVNACMARLGKHPREILTLRNSLHLSYDEIARQLGIRIGTVKSRVARTRDRLKVLLNEACPEFGATAEPDAWFDPVRPDHGTVSCV